MTPAWLIQLLWFGASIGGGGAVWYFLSQQSYYSALCAGIATVALVSRAIALHIRNDHLKREQQTATGIPHSTSDTPALPNESAAATPSIPHRPEESQVVLREKSPADEEIPATDAIADKATLTLDPQRLIIREKSAAEILGNLKGITLQSQFYEKVEELYVGRWTREPGWQATVYQLPSKLSERLWICSFKEVSSGTLIMARTDQDISTLRPGDSVTVSGRISDVSWSESVTLEDAKVMPSNH